MAEICEKLREHGNRIEQSPDDPFTVILGPRGFNLVAVWLERHFRSDSQNVP